MAHEWHKRTLYLIIVGIKEKEDEEKLAIVKEQLKTHSQIQTTYLIEVQRVGDII